ncbi:hypothetical protein ElyMa_002809100 [Elysia marginata]|uniref:PiggyBac transposable element-derived protein domain-containing protein n=1 Tax=Elysia marginata TaxID=1093978 RepID=A0AAV4HQI7_9GAST|nr:hypothetical protein ElyMa_002809100 [Elysia marginata]
MKVTSKKWEVRSPSSGKEIHKMRTEYMVLDSTVVEHTSPLNWNQRRPSDIRGEERWTDVSLIETVMTLLIAPLQGNRPTTVRASYNVNSLQVLPCLAQFQETVDRKLQHGLTLESSFKYWCSFKDAIVYTANKHLDLELKPENMKTGSR